MPGHQQAGHYGLFWRDPFADRIKLADAVFYFKADGKSRGKLGIHPSREKAVAGSYDAERHVLTII